MNVECTYKGSTVNMMEINPAEDNGFLDIIYVDASGDMKFERIAYPGIVATSVTKIGGRILV